MKRLLPLLLILTLTGCYEDAKDAVKAQLKDPYSAEFYDVRQGRTGSVTCGTVRAANALSGFRVSDFYVLWPDDHARTVVKFAPDPDMGTFCS